MQRKLDDDDLDREEEKYFSEDDFAEDIIEDFDLLPLGDYDDDEPIDDDEDDEELIHDNFIFGDDESYEETYEDDIEEVEVDDENKFENDFFNSIDDEDEWN